MIGSLERAHEMDARPTVFVVEDDVSVRESIELLVCEAGWGVELFETARAFLAQLQPADVPRCLVLDMALPDVNGLDLQRSLAGCTEMPIIFITGSRNVPMTVRAMKAGAFEFLVKPFESDVLLQAIEQAIRHSTLALTRHAELRALEAAYASLTSREREVMTLVVAGDLNKQIAAKLGITVITVKAHRGKVMRKMEAESPAALVKIHARLCRD
jgi:FixJ family two-component response regulator